MRFLYETAVMVTACAAVAYFRLAGKPEVAASVWEDAMAELDAGIEADRKRWARDR